MLTWASAEAAAEAVRALSGFNLGGKQLTAVPLPQWLQRRLASAQGASRALFNGLKAAAGRTSLS